MSIADVVSRVSELTSLAQRAATPTLDPATAPAFSRTLEPLLGADSSAAALDAQPSYFTPPDALALGTAAGTPAQAPTAATQPAGAQLLAAAESQVGQAELPPGSNDGPALGVYRGAVQGAQPGEPWCAYFASWAAAQAGHPLGEEGQGYGAVSEIQSWAERTGRLLPASSTPAPGDLILFGDRHVGIVESVNADGSLTTVEGNYSNAVSRVHRSPAEATGFVRV